MNDVLAKPFTKEGMVRILKKHLPYLLKNPPPPGSSGDDMSQSAGVAGAQGYGNSTGMGMVPMSAGSNISAMSGGVKFQTTPIQSPATTASWHSPGGQMPHASPNMDGGKYRDSNYMAAAVNGGGSMVLAPGGQQRQNYPGGPPQPMANHPMRGLPEGIASDDRPEKRQRLYGPAQTQYS